MTPTEVITTSDCDVDKDTSKGRIHSIGIAGIVVVHAPDQVRTILGSCIGIALYDPVAKIGGLGHVILPNSREGSGGPGKFADTAVDLLLSDLNETGANGKCVRAKIAGGAAMFGGDSLASLGRRNAEAVRDRLSHHGIRLVAEAIGGTKGRKMCLDPATGNVRVEIIGESPQDL